MVNNICLLDVDGVDITNNLRYAAVVGFIRTIRNALCQNTHLRQPYIQLLTELHLRRPPKPAFEFIRQVPPTDVDLRIYFSLHWPEIRLAECCSSSKGCRWGCTNIGEQAADNNRLHINAGLVKHFPRMTSVAQPTFSSQKLATLIFAAIVHELGHRTLAWWSRDICHTPTYQPFSKESGVFVEKRFFGGVIGASWFDDNWGRFDHIEDLVLELSKDDVRVIDTHTAYHKFLSFHLPGRTLPLIDASKIPMKSCATPLIMQYFTATMESEEVVPSGSLAPFAHVGLGITTSFICNDKVDLGDRGSSTTIVHN